MTATYVYYDATGAWSVELGNQVVRLGDLEGFSEVAYLGENGTSGIDFDDPGNTVGHSGDGIRGLKAFRVEESAEGANNKRIVTGYLIDRTYKRGDSAAPSIRTGVARRIAANFLDLNAGLTFLLISGSDGNRSAETVGARLTWLLASTYSDFFDNGYVVYPGSPTMDASDYRTQTAGDVLADLALAASYNYFLYYDEAAGQISLWFDDSNSSTAFSSSLWLTNDSLDVDSTPETLGATGIVAATAELNRSPDKVASRAAVPYANGTVYVTNGTTQTTYARRERVAPNANVKSSANAIILANNYLAQNATEDDLLTIDLKVPAAAVNHIRAGQRVPAKFTHLGNMDAPTYDDWTWVRVVRRAVIQTETTPEVYTLRLECSPQEGAVTAPSPPLVAEFTVAGAALGECGPLAGDYFAENDKLPDGPDQVASYDANSYAKVVWNADVSIPQVADTASSFLDFTTDQMYDAYECVITLDVASVFPSTNISVQTLIIPFGDGNDIVRLISDYNGGTLTETVDLDTGTPVTATGGVTGTVSIDASRSRGTIIITAGGVSRTYSQSFPTYHGTGLECEWVGNATSGARTFQQQISNVKIVAACTSAYLFTNTSNFRGSQTGWLWDFGDGTTSTLENPFHGFTLAGPHTVTLTTTWTTGSDGVSHAVS